MFRCALAGESWSPEPDPWGPLVIKRDDFPPVEIRAYMREARISQYGTAELERASTWATLTGSVTVYPTESMHRHTVLLEAKENAPLVKRGNNAPLSLANVAQIVAVAVTNTAIEHGYKLVDAKSRALPSDIVSPISAFIFLS